MAADIEAVSSELTESAVYHSRAVPSAAIAGTRLIEPAAGTRDVVDSNDGFRIEIVPGVNLRNQFGALAAVERAAAQWEAMLNDPITVSIQIDLQFEEISSSQFGTDLPAEVLGFARPVEVELPYAQIRTAMQNDGLIEQDDSILASLPSPESIEFAYPGSLRYDDRISLTKANLKALGLHSESVDDELGVADGQILLNPEALLPNQPHRFDYNRADGISPGQFDFESLVVHEIGHVLGFISSVDRIDQAIRAGVTETAIAPSTLDLFRFRSLPGSGNPRTAAAFEEVRRELRPSTPAVMDFVTADGWTTLDHEYPVELGEDIGLIDPGVAFGYQASHWQAEDLFGIPIGVMAPALPPQTISPISNVDLRVFDLIGYDVLPPGEPLTAPELRDDAATVNSQRTIVIDALANDQNNTRALNLSSLRIVESPAGGSVEFDPVTGFFVYTADADFAGEDIFSYIVADDRGIYAQPALVSVQVIGTAVGEAPIATDDFVLVRQNQSVTFDPLANDRDEEESLSFANLRVEVQPAHGAVRPGNNRLVYVPRTDFVGDDSLTYSIADSDGNRSSAVVRITVGATLPPVVISGLPLSLMQRADLSGDARVTAIDALMVINYLDRRGTNSIVTETDTNAHDVNADGQVTALDALVIINALSRSDGGTAVVAVTDLLDREDDDPLLGSEPAELF
ncbi:Dockerin type I repeat protein [Stieleria neptunia]|uniref:Dockerin type I repeat protein n=2 Tax=Stieleria neptunia TaxID=2527979 RepID=A0A518HYJ8_9BACT|nr:Dockerin type I repeat protein [Stieleria neptunia]